MQMFWSSLLNLNQICKNLSRDVPPLFCHDAKGITLLFMNARSDTSSSIVPPNIPVPAVRKLSGVAGVRNPVML